jgi:hypothetical protein
VDLRAQDVGELQVQRPVCAAVDIHVFSVRSSTRLDGHPSFGRYSPTPETSRPLTVASAPKGARQVQTRTPRDPSAMFGAGGAEQWVGVDVGAVASGGSVLDVQVRGGGRGVAGVAVVPEGLTLVNLGAAGDARGEPGEVRVVPGGPVVAPPPPGDCPPLTTRFVEATSINVIVQQAPGDGGFQQPVRGDRP